MANWWSETWEPNPVRSVGKLYLRIALFCEQHDLGNIWPADNGFQCFPHAPGMVRRPDVSFVKRGRLPGDVSPDGWIKIAPDLAVEVVSPNDVVEELEAKLETPEGRYPSGLGDLSEATQGGVFRLEARKRLG